MKYKRLNDGAIVHIQETMDIIEQVRQGKHVYIDWKSNLQYIMKREFLETDRCDFGLGIMLVIEPNLILKSIVVPKVQKSFWTKELLWFYR